MVKIRLFILIKETSLKYAGGIGERNVSRKLLILMLEFRSSLDCKGKVLAKMIKGEKWSSWWKDGVLPWVVKAVAFKGENDP